MAVAVSSREGRSQLAVGRWFARRSSPVLAVAGLVACGLHVVLWWGWTHQGWTGAKAGVASTATAAVHVRLGSPRDTHDPVDPAAMHADAPVRAQATAGASPNQGADRSPPEGTRASEGSQWLTGRYAPADTLDQSPRPELGWFLDEDVLAPLPHASMLVQLWVSAEGRIDRAELLRAEPAGDWALRALAPLPGTPMRPGVRDGRPVAATLVVELVSDNERFR